MAEELTELTMLMYRELLGNGKIEQVSMPFIVKSSLQDPKNFWDLAQKVSEFNQLVGITPTAYIIGKSECVAGQYFVSPVVLYRVIE